MLQETGKKGFWKNTPQDVKYLILFRQLQQSHGNQDITDEIRKNIDSYIVCQFPDGVLVHIVA